MTKIGILGISGRMGRLLAEEVSTAGATLAGGTARRGEQWPADPRALARVSDVLIDFTTAEAAEPHLQAALEARKPLILGTSGLNGAQEAALAEAGRDIPIVYAANFSPGVNLLLAVAERLAAGLPPESYDAEIVETHHRQKIDAPSGTAIALGRAVAAGRGTTLEEAGIESGRDGHTGPRKTGAIGFAALRAGQVVGEHTLLFASGSEHIALTHRSFERRVYATGAVRAALWAVRQPPGLYGMKHVLGMG
ncbi:4-hydroxy-tetrahydrodipicolinate reductase [Roseomonas sp. SSH11]|uniref:4-hydroxy-tetrahydrodipicolinate reductase n=1 Tax=Pararoseomonas baculiformis TaxID=2820812 RepID=A0ABS4AJI1_9PROT|nr:4-hydroxy-tetrahydrodipicolinate reductase [Pararoseomonas baculiformis]MBP0446379.1 4-hydroxy-tetrahydrodipicolinate reductase [Pararoseomonas baculiformis]